MLELSICMHVHVQFWWEAYPLKQVFSRMFKLILAGVIS